VTVERTDAEVLVRVADHGIGIPESDQKHLFERFFRSSNAGEIQGTGLGLSIVAHYVNLLKGTITFKSKENKGTTFFINLPRNF
jgi:signal transduction histidine kinase